MKILRRDFETQAAVGRRRYSAHYDYTRSLLAVM